MATIVDQAVCIRHWDWSETSQTVSLLTREHGVVRGLAKGSRRERGAFSGGIELATRGELVAILKNTDALSTLTSWELRSLHAGLRRSLNAYNAGMYLIDLVFHAVTDRDPHPELFDALCRGLEALGADDAAVERAVLGFQWAMLSETGYRPDLDIPGTLDVVRFRPELGRFSADDQSGWRVRGATVELLASLDAGGLASADEEAVARANRLLAAYIRHVLGREPPTMRVYWGGDPLSPARATGAAKGDSR